MKRNALSAEYLMLRSLRVGGSATVYELQQRVKLTGLGLWELSNGAAYPCLRRLLASGLVLGDRMEVDTAAGRAPLRYSLSAAGQASIDAASIEVRRWC